MKCVTPIILLIKLLKTGKSIQSNSIAQTNQENNLIDRGMKAIAKYIGENKDQKEAEIAAECCVESKFLKSNQKLIWSIILQYIKNKRNVSSNCFVIIWKLFNRIDCQYTSELIKNNLNKEASHRRDIQYFIINCKEIGSKDSANMIGAISYSIKSFKIY